jgi:lysophospholipase
VGTVIQNEAATEIIPGANLIDRHELLERALADSPNGYVPSPTSCGPKPAEIRKPFDISPEEKAWLEKRRPVVADALRKFIKRTNISKFDSDTYLRNIEESNGIPVVSLAMSGGGYRALLTGAGALAAFDDRTRTSTEPGHLGGLLQSSTYVSGLSGGGWLVGSIYANNFTGVEAILDASAAGHGNVWDFNRSIIDGPPHGHKFWKSIDYWKDIYEQIKDKKHAGFNSSITDYWARGLSFQLINSTDGGAGRLSG